MKTNSIRSITMTAIMITLIIVLGLFPGIPVGFLPVPIILQNFGIMLAGELLGPKRGILAVALFLVLVVLGFPFLSGGNGGLASFVGPTGGAILSWLVTPLMIGSVLKLTWWRARWWREWLVLFLFGVLWINLCEIIWLATIFHFGFSKALIAEMVFLPGDVIKASLSVMVARRLRKILSHQFN